VCRGCNGEACDSYLTGIRAPVKKLTDARLDLVELRFRFTPVISDALILDLEHNTV